MRIIDEKGRLFGKINVIDFLAIVFLISLMPMFYYGFKLCYLARKTAIEIKTRAEEKEFIEINLNFVFDKLKPNIFNLISVGDKERDKEGKVIGEIIKLGRVEPVIYEIDIGAGKKLVKEDPVLKKLNTTIKIKAVINQGQLYYKNDEISFNSPIVFKTREYVVRAICLSLEKHGTGVRIVSIDQESNEIIVQKETIGNIINRIQTLEEKINSVSPSQQKQVDNRIQALEGKVNSLLPKYNKIKKR